VPYLQSPIYDAVLLRKFLLRFILLKNSNYTEFGWGFTRAPQELTDELRAAIFEGLPNARLEGMF
jgi:hypothetical protein